MHLEWYLWVALVVLLVRTPFCFVAVQRESDRCGDALHRECAELVLTVAALVAVIAHGTGSW